MTYEYLIHQQSICLLSKIYEKCSSSDKKRDDALRGIRWSSDAKLLEKIISKYVFPNYFVPSSVCELLLNTLKFEMLIFELGKLFLSRNREMMFIFVIFKNF